MRAVDCFDSDLKNGVIFYIKRRKNMDKQLTEFCLTFGGILAGIHHHVQDYKRSFSWSTDHGSVET